MGTVINEPLSDESSAVLHKYMDSVAFYVVVHDYFFRHRSMSAVRMGDGERAIIQTYQGALPRRYLKNDEWLRKYGLRDSDGNTCDLDWLGSMLLDAGNSATYFGPNMAGLWKEFYDLTTLFKPRDTYIPGLFSCYWGSLRLVHAFLRLGKICVVCGQSAGVKGRLERTYDLSDGHVEGIELRSYLDISRVLDAVEDSKAQIFLFAGGPPGKMLVVDCAREGKICLDVGHAMVALW